MAAPDHYTGENGLIYIDTVLTSVADFFLDVNVDVVDSKQVGESCDLSFPGKKHVSGGIEEMLISGALFAMLIGDTGDITTSSLEVLLAATDLDAAAREELVITSDPTDPTTVKALLTVGDAVTTAGSIMIHGTDGSGAQVTETLNFDAMAVGDGSQAVQGLQVFATTDFVTIMAALESGSPGNYSTIKLDGVDGTKTLTLGQSTYFDVIGKVEDGAGNHWQLTAPDCFFTAGKFPVGDANTIVISPMPFTMKDPTALELDWLAV